MQALADAVHKEGLKKMSVRERASIEEKVSMLKEQLTRPPQDKNDSQERSNPDALQDPARIRAELKKFEELLNKDSDLIPQGTEKDRLVKRLKELCYTIKKESLTQREESLKPTNPQDYNRAVEKQVAHQRAQLKNIKEAQEIGKRLEPNDPEAGNIKALLKKYA